MAIAKQAFYEGAALHQLARSTELKSIRFEAPFFVLNESVLKVAAYCALGPATKIHIEGDRPMSLHWKLEVALPMELFRAFSVLRG